MDLDFYGIAWNCCSIPLGKLLDRGFVTGHGALRPPATIRSAAILMCILIQSNQNEMFGGQAIPLLDYDLAKYVAKSYIRNCITYIKADHVELDSKALKADIVVPVDEYIAKHSHVITPEGMTYINDVVAQVVPDTDFEDMHAFALQQTEEETKQAMEAVIHNLCSLNSRSGGQVPFSSVNFGTDTSEEGRMVSRNLMNALDEGLGAGETAIFPIAIFKMKKGITDKGSKNYDLFQQSCRVSAKRLFPNWLNLDAPFNAQFYKEGHSETEADSMGCVTSGIIDVRVAEGTDEAGHYVGDISKFYEWLVQNRYITDDDVINFDKHTDYVNLFGFEIYDTLAGGYVEAKKFMRFASPDTKWVQIDYSWQEADSSGNNIKKTATILVSDDHPLPAHSNRGTKGTNIVTHVVEHDGSWYLSDTGLALERIYAGKLTAGDQLIVYDSVLGKNHVTLATIEKCTNVFDVSRVGYDFETVSDHFTVDQLVTNNCRTRVISNYCDPDKAVVPGRGNMAVVTINLPYLALECKEQLQPDEDLVDKFMKDVDETIDACIQQLDDRFEVICKRTGKNYPFLIGQGVYLDSEKVGPDDSVRPALMHATRTVGFIGLAETLRVLIGKHHGESHEAQELGLKIISHMNERVTDYAKERHVNYSFMGSPAEGCTGRLAKLLRKRFGDIPWITDKGYLTNSSHCPVDYSISAYDKVMIEAPYHALEPAGLTYWLCLNPVNACQSGVGL